MKNEPHQIVKDSCERIREHSTKIREAQIQLTKAIADAAKDHVNFNSLYIAWEK